MTIAETALLLLNDFSVEERSIPDSADYPGRNAEVVKAINAALQELFGEGSPWLRYDEQGFLIYGPTNVTIAVTSESKTADVVTGWADWMEGCAIVIDGSTVENQIRGASASSENPDIITITGSLTSNGTTPVEIPTLIRAGTLGLRPAYSDNGSQIGYAWLMYYNSGPAQWSIRNSDGSVVWNAASGTDTLPQLATGWTPVSPATGTPAIEASRGVSLKFPFNATTGTVSATVYHTSIAIPSTVMEVCDPVKMDRRTLAAVVSSGVPILTRYEEDYGANGVYRTIPTPDTIQQSTGIPVAYAVETYSAGDTSSPATRLRLLPAPASAGTLEIRAKIAPPVISSITSNSTLPIPQQFIQTIFFPVARMHLSGCPFFLHSSAGSEVQRSYQEARRLLDKLSPTKNQGRIIRTLY